MYFLELHKVQLVTNIKINVNARVMQFVNNFKKYSALTFTTEL